MNQEEIRKQFETWADENQYALDRSDINKEVYRNNLTRNAWLGYQAALESKQCEISHLQFKIDSLMLEFCPDAMTSEQMENWAKHQKKVSAKLEESITKTVTTGEIREDLKDAVCFASDGKERDWAEQEHIESNQDLAQRLLDAMEGELNGLTTTIETAENILAYVLNHPKAIDPAQPKGE